MSVIIEEANISDEIQRAIKKAIVDYEKYSEEQLRKLWYLYYNARKNIEYQIATRWAKWVKDPSDPLAIGRLRNLQDAIETEMNILNRKLHNQLPVMITGAGEKGIQMGQAEMAALLKNMSKTITPSYSVINRAAIEVYANYALQLSDADTIQALKQIQSRLQLGLIQGDTIGKLTTDIRQLIGAEFGVPAKGLTFKARRIAITESGRAFSAGHTAFGRSTDWITGERWNVNPIGEWPCSECEALEGKEYYYKSGEERPQLPLHPLCYDKDTEIYTDEGWKLFKEVVRGEEVLTLNPDSLKKEYSRVKNCISYKYNGDMIYFNSQWVDLLVTPDHRMVYWKWGEIESDIIANIFSDDKVLLVGRKGKFCQEFEKKRVRYNDFVYDVEVEKNHIILTRRNGKVVWGSNCRCYTTYIFRQNLFTKDELGKLKREVRGKL